MRFKWICIILNVRTGIEESIKINIAQNVWKRSCSKRHRRMEKKAANSAPKSFRTKLSAKERMENHAQAKYVHKTTISTTISGRGTPEHDQFHSTLVLFVPLFACDGVSAFFGWPSKKNQNFNYRTGTKRKKKTKEIPNLWANTDAAVTAFLFSVVHFFCWPFAICYWICSSRWIQSVTSHHSSRFDGIS